MTFTPQFITCAYNFEGHDSHGPHDLGLLPLRSSVRFAGMLLALSVSLLPPAFFEAPGFLP